MRCTKAIVATANTATISTGIAIRDKHLMRSDYFNTKQYPEIRLVSKSIRKSGRQFIGEFDLTIKGITRTVAIPFTVRRHNNATLYRGSFEINRLDFKLGEKSAILDERVEIYISATG
jgi:polyisoprenoid-binding protein YceI